MSTFAENLRRVREEHNLTQSDLAVRLNVAQAFVSQLETGRRHPSPALVKRIAAALTVDPQVLTAGEAEIQHHTAIINRKLKGLSPETLRRIENYVTQISNKDDSHE